MTYKNYFLMLEERVADSPVVCFLVINRMPILPSLAIQSVLRNSDAMICIGYTNINDLIDLPTDDRISLVQLDRESVASVDASTHYADFEKNTFYQIVQLKWNLLEKCLDSFSGRTIIYNDIDVIWMKDATIPVVESFEKDSKVHIIIQDYTSNPARPELCMGFVGIRNSQESLKIINLCKNQHGELLMSNPKVGDDNVISVIYSISNSKESFQLLPQSTFPVGNMINNFRPFSIFPGLAAYKPYLFHANFVVGIERKIILTKLALKLINPDWYRTSMLSKISIYRHTLPRWFKYYFLKRK